MIPVLPVSVIPIPMSPHCVSGPAMQIGIAAGKPNFLAFSIVNLPAISPSWVNGGRNEESMPIDFNSLFAGRRD